MDTPRIADGTRPPWTDRFRALVRLWVELFGRHGILNNASAISFQALKALVPLGLFGTALLGVLGLSDVWGNWLSESFARQFTPPVYTAIDTTVTKIMTERSPALPVFAGVLLLWYLSGLVRACMGGLNTIYEAVEPRPLVRRWAVSFALAVGVIGAILVAVLTFTIAPRTDIGGTSHVLLLVVRWPVAVITLGLAVGLLIRFAPAEHRPKRWASVGAAVIVAGWLIQSLLFAWFVRAFADFTSASGALTVFLVLAAFLYAASIIFLVGVEIDEQLRKDASPDDKGIIGALRTGTKR